MKIILRNLLIIAAIGSLAAITGFSQEKIFGYTYGQTSLKHSPISLEDFDKLKQSVLFNNEDVKYLRMSKDILKDQTDAILDVWRFPSQFPLSSSISLSNYSNLKAIFGRKGKFA